MDAIDRLKLLSSQMAFEPDGEPRPSTSLRSAQDEPPNCFTSKEKDQVFVHPTQMPNGHKIMLLKTLLSSACERDCFYCPFRAGRDFRRATFQPDEFASLFGKLTHAGAAEGVFLTAIPVMNWSVEVIFLKTGKISAKVGKLA